MVSDMFFYHGSGTDVGNFRPNNEDSIMSCSMVKETSALCIGLVCDGVGGTKSGEYASHKMTLLFQEWWDKLKLINASDISFEYITAELMEHTHRVNSIICMDSAINSIQTGSTLSGIIIVNDKYMTFNVGDSRVYLIKNKMLQLTSDDVAYVERNGKTTAVLTQCIGNKQNIFVNTTVGSVADGDTFMFCSDGFYKLMKETDIVRKLFWCGKKKNISGLCCCMIDEIKRRGEKDNISVGIIKCFEK